MIAVCEGYVKLILILPKADQTGNIVTKKGSGLNLTLFKLK
jgi:hypothetical protein